MTAGLDFIVISAGKSGTTSLLLFSVGGRLPALERGPTLGPTA